MTEDLRTCRCDECEVWDPLPNAVDVVWWRGNRYGIDEFWSNYYSRKDRNQRRFLLHREIYEAHHGPIPEGFIVHHRNHDKYDNQPENLVVISRGEHNNEEGHGTDKLRAYVESHTPEEWGQRTKDLLWSKRQPRDVTCATCGVVFRSTGMRAKFCDKHGSRAGHQRRRNQTPSV